jgi:Phage gp6-like head-tail connector protein
MKSLKNYILAMSVISILVISAGSVALPALTTVPAFATHDTTTDTTDDTTTDTTNNNDDEQFSEDVEACLYDVIGQYFNNDNNLGTNSDSQDNNNISSDNNNNIEPSSQET